MAEVKAYSIESSQTPCIDDHIEEVQARLDRIASLFGVRCMAVIAKPDGQVVDITGQGDRDLLNHQGIQCPRSYH